MSIKQDMGTGSIKALMVKMAVPALVGQVINLLYNIVDRIYIGHIPEVGGSALTGVGLFTPILMLIPAFAVLAGAGGAPRAAIAMGQGDKKRAEKILGNCFTVLMILAVLLTISFYAAAPVLLRLFGASDATLPYAVAYGRIYILGTVFVLTVMGMNTFITTQGFAKISMMTTVIGAVINIVLDPIFIFLLDLGVAGAALASVLSQAVSAVWILRFLTGKQTVLRLKKENMKLESAVILPCLGLGVSSFVMLSTESILSVSFTSSLARFGGDVAVGAMTVLTSINQLVSMPLMGICQGGQPLISYNYGAKKLDRVHKGVRVTVCSALVWAVLMQVLIPLGPTLIGFFSNTPAVIEAGTVYLKCIMPFFILFAVMFCLNNAMQGAGDSMFSMMNAIFSLILVRVPMVYLLANRFGPDYMYYGIGIGWCIGFLLSTFYYFSGRWQRFSAVKNENPGEIL